MPETAAGVELGDRHALGVPDVEVGEDGGRRAALDRLGQAQVRRRAAGGLRPAGVKQENGCGEGANGAHRQGAILRDPGQPHLDGRARPTVSLIGGSLVRRPRAPPGAPLP